MIYRPVVFYRPGYVAGMPWGISPNMMWAADVPAHMSQGPSSRASDGNPSHPAMPVRDDPGTTYISSFISCSSLLIERYGATASNLNRSRTSVRASRSRSPDGNPLARRINARMSAFSVRLTLAGSSSGIESRTRSNN